MTVETETGKLNSDEIPAKFRKEITIQGVTHVLDTRRTYSWQIDANGSGYYEECLSVWSDADKFGIYPPEE